MKHIFFMMIMYCLLYTTAASQHFSSAFDYEDTIYASYYSRLHMPSSKENCLCEGYMFDIQSGQAEIIQEQGCLFFIRPLISFGLISIKVFDSNSRLIHYVSAHVTDKIPLPSVEVYCGNCKSHGPPYLRQIDSLVCKISYRGGYYGDSLNNRVKFRVEYFVGQLVRGDSVFYSEVNYGNAFQKEYGRRYLKAKMSDKLVFRNIIITDDLGNRYYIPRTERRVAY